jgi:hypothetical protein
LKEQKPKKPKISFTPEQQAWINQTINKRYAAAKAEHERNMAALDKEFQRRFNELKDNQEWNNLL